MLHVLCVKLRFLILEVPIGGVGGAEASMLDSSRAGSPRNCLVIVEGCEGSRPGISEGGCDAGLEVKVKSPKSKLSSRKGKGAAGTASIAWRSACWSAAGKEGNNAMHYFQLMRK